MRAGSDADSAPTPRQELEFIIHADGRVEERVRGVKGANCQEITAKIESALGEVRRPSQRPMIARFFRPCAASAFRNHSPGLLQVYHTEATEEMYEVEVQNTNENTNSAEWGSGGGGEGDSGGGGGGWSGGGGW